MIQRFIILLAGIVAGWSLPAEAAAIVQLNAAQQWRLVEFRIDNVPAGSNPFDPETISVDAAFTGPSGTNAAVPGFWYQKYSRTLSNNKESVSPQGSPEWRVRFTPEESGDFALTVAVTLNGQPSGSPASITFNVLTHSLTAATGFITMAPNRQYFAARSGKAFPLVGENVCWPGNRGTYDYDTWFPALQNAGGNFARLWMAPWAFGIESEPGLLNHYRLDRAWQLDYVFKLAEQKGIYLLLCLEYHGMFETEPDYWGGNNNWPKNPYNAALGGPCPNQNAFFTNATAQTLYQKRLRYLVGRYGYSPQLLAWEFFNEIDNVYRYLNPADVASWHRQMGDWLRARDPYRHLVTTSLTGGSDRSDLWTLPQLDFAMFHSYGLAEPAPGLNAVVQSFLRKYQKPVMIGEFGINWQGWSRADDPYLRALRQGLWGGLLGGSVGTSMPWYWESLHSENAYLLFQGLTNFVGKTKLGQGDWQPVSARQSPPPPVTVGALITNGQPFTARLDFNSQWGAILRGLIAVPTPESALESSGALNSFIHGTGHPELRIPCKLHAWFGENARLVLHLNSVSDRAIMSVRVDGSEVFRRSLTNIDNSYQVNNEYNEDIPVNLPAGKHQIEIRNAGGDWFYLDWVRLENVLPSEYEGAWQALPIAIGLKGEGETLLYVASPKLKYPAKVTTLILDPMRQASLTLSNWPSGTFHALWYDPVTGAKAGQTQGTALNSLLTLPLPDFSEDLAGRMIREFSLLITADLAHGTATLKLLGDSGLDYTIESSTNLLEWLPVASLPPSDGSMEWQVPLDKTTRYFRAAVY